MSFRILQTLAAAALLALPSGAPSLSSADLAAGFRRVPPDARMRMYWRVFGPAWTEPEIDRQLLLMKEAGLGGTTVYFLYPVELDDPASGIVNQRFGSSEFLRTFAYAARKAEELGLSFAVNGGTGWPYGGPTVAPGDAAIKLREIRVAQGSASPEDLRPSPGRKIVAAFEGGRDVTDAVRREGVPAPAPEDYRLYVEEPTGQGVKRASYGGEGPVLAHFDRGALERWLAATAQPLVEAAGKRLSGFGCDSLEVYRANWASDLPAEFRKRRGYELLTRLPDLFDDAAPERPALRFDFWRTLGELTEERFIEPLGAWCQKRGLTLEMEPYGTPPSPMTSARFIALPTGEHYEWKGYAVQRYVASMARIAGRAIVGSEAWTWAGLPNRLGDRLSDIKLVSDMTFLLGSNDLTGVDFPYSPSGAGAPGWLPYYGPSFGPGNPQWRFFPALVSYLNRCQWMLRQGEPVRPVAVYLPVEDAFAEGPADQMLLDFAVRDRLATGHPTSEFGLGNAFRHQSDLVDGLIGAGLDFDGADFWAVSRMGAADGRHLKIGKGTYEAIVLPNLDRMDLAALERVAAFARGGGIVVATRRLPAEAAGLVSESVRDRFRGLVDEIFGADPGPGFPHACGLGRGLFLKEDREAGPALAGLIVPSVRFSPRPPTVGFVHRRAGGKDIYFIVNVGPGEASFSAEFPGPVRDVEAWDALSGTMRRESGTSSRVDIRLPARGSIFLVAGANTPGLQPAPRPKVQAAEQTLVLAPEWALAFDGPDAPPPARLDKLISWTNLPGGRFFSGTGVYRASFRWEGDPPASARLDFDDVREAAEVRLNGRLLGVVFEPRLELDAAGALRSGDNALEITVANLPLNRFLGLPDKDLAPLRAKFGNRFPDPEEKKIASPAPSGLLGGIRLVSRRLP